MVEKKKKEEPFERQVKKALNDAVRVGILRKFWSKSDWKYIDNKVPPSQEELLQEKHLVDWVKPSDEDQEAKWRLIGVNPSKPKGAKHG